MSVAGCAHVEILSTRVNEVTSDQIILEVVTNKDLSRFDDTYYADHVYMSYRPAGTVVSSEFKNPGKRWDFPFSVTLRESRECGPGRYCSRWSIPVADSANLELNKYTYELGEGGELRMKLGGGSMGGGRFHSNIVVMKIPSIAQDLPSAGR